jgi:fibronectin type 3 domain-containing protein
MGNPGKHPPLTGGMTLKTSFYLLGSVCVALCLGLPAQAMSPVGDVVGTVTVGYQGWFSCAGDGAPIGGWWHYTGGSTPTPITLTNSIHCWPDMRQFTHVYQTGFTNFGNGQPATLFSSYDQQTVDTHFRWMAENGIDTAALQRFNPTGGEGPTRDAMTLKVKLAAEAYGRKFYIMYDCSGWPSNTFDGDIKNDWVTKMSAYTNSPAYACQNGKPVVCIWGLGMNDANHPWSPAICLDVVNWFKSQGCYVIGGTRRDWRTVDATYLPLYQAMNMISPWMIGSIGSVSDADNTYNTLWLPDEAYCNANGMDYQPCILCGDTGQRVHGNLMWEIFFNAKKLGAQGLYISMFDEFNEGNQIACTAENASMSPIGTSSLYFTLDQDGTACSSDYYLRLTGDGGRMFKGILALTPVRPTVPLPTLVAPPAPANLAAQGGNGRVTLNWDAVTGAADALSYNVRRATASAGPYTLIATNVGNISYTDTGVTNNATYYYVASAVNSLNESGYSAVAAGTPAVSYAVDSGGGAAGSFTADAYYSGGNTSTTGAGIDTSAVTNPAPQAVYQTDRWGPNIYTFTNLTPGASYNVRLHFAEIYYNTAGARLFNVAINGSQVLANFDVFATAGTNNKAVIKEFTRSATGSGQITVQYSNGTKDNAKSSGIEIVPINTAPLSSPANLTATANSSSDISLTWTAAATATSYNVKRSGTSGGSYTNRATGINATGYRDTQLAAGTSYYYEVSVVSTGVESTNSLPVGATTQALPSPAIPGNLMATPGNSQVTLNWLAASWAASYSVKRSTTSGSGYSVIASNVTSTVYLDPGRTNGTTYYYVLSAQNSAGTSANSAEAGAMAGQLSQAGWVASASSADSGSPVSNAVDGNLSTRWSTGAGQTPGQWFELDMGSTNIFNTMVLNCGTSTADYPRGYQVNVSNDGVNWGSPVATGTGAAVTTITFATQTARYVRVTQTGSAAANWWSLAEIKVLGTVGPLPTVPTGLTAAPGAGQITASWTAAPGATGYNLKRALVSGGAYTTVGVNLPFLTYTNIGLLNGTNYYYVVSATNSFGESANSAEVSAQPFSLALTVTTPSAGGFTLAWATNAAAKLYFAPDLTASAGWTLVTNLPAASNGQWMVTLPIGTNPAGFYRLQ